MEKNQTIKITIWNEGRHEKIHPNVAQIYPGGIHGAIAEGLKNEGFIIRSGSLDDPDEDWAKSSSTTPMYFSGGGMLPMTR
ncbi:MAG: hypothetical protein WAK31_15390 [Chthoniobacterales bacterium]